MTKRPPTVSRPRPLAGYVVDLPDLNRLHVAILFDRDQHRRDVTPPIRLTVLHQELVSGHDDVRFAEGPGTGVIELERRRQVLGIALRGALGYPLTDHRDLIVVEGRVVLEVLDTDVLLSIPRRHRAHAVTNGRALSDPSSVAPGILVPLERHRGHTAGRDGSSRSCAAGSGRCRDCR